MNNVLSNEKNEHLNNKQILTNNYMSSHRLKNEKEENNVKKTFTNLSILPFNFPKIKVLNNDNCPFKDSENSFIIRKNSKSTINSIVVQRHKKIYNFNYPEKLNLKRIEKVIEDFISISKKKKDKKFKKNFQNYNNYNIDLSSQDKIFHTYSPISPLRFLVKKNNSNKDCIICNNSFYKNDKLIYLDKCKHILCKYCFKAYFESQIEKGEIKLNCPLFKCNKKINLNIIKDNISKKSYDIYLQNWEKLEKTKNVIKENIIDNNEKIYEKFSKKHVAEITNDEEIYFSLNKIKNQFCPNCGTKKLFTVPQWSIIKCLNCLKWYCKYCFKEVDNSHFNKFSEKYCRVYSMKNNIIIPGKKNFFQSNKILFLLIRIYASFFIGFLMLFIASFFIFIKLFKKKINGFLFSSIYILFLGTFFFFYTILLIIFFIIILPYYPFINYFMDFILD